MQDEMISIIVPVYKTEPWINRCVDSILKQTYKNFELILVDDGSPDRCGEICDEYAAIDQRIVVIHQNNHGVSAARNVGLNIAKGEYIGFVDSDDTISTKMFHSLIEAIEENETDISCCAMYIQKENGDQYFHEIQSKNKVNQTDFAGEILSRKNGIGGTVWNKLFKRSKIDDLRFNENAKICEDVLFTLEYCKKVTCATYINKPLYCYCERQGSAVHTDRYNSALALPVHEKLIHVAKEIGWRAFFVAEAEYLDCCLQYIDYKEARIFLVKYLRSHIMTVSFNPVIYWKTKVLYLKNSLIIWNRI